MDDLLGVEVEHTVSYLSGPTHHLRGQDLFLSPDEVVEVALVAVLHDNAETWRLCTHTSEEGESEIVCDIYFVIITSLKHTIHSSVHISLVFPYLMAIELRGLLQV